MPVIHDRYIIYIRQRLFGQTERMSNRTLSITAVSC